MGFALVFSTDLKTRLYAFQAMRQLRYDVGCVSTLDEAMAFASEGPSLLVVEDSTAAQRLIERCTAARMVLVNGDGTHTSGRNVHYFSQSSDPAELLTRIRRLLRPTVDHMAWFRPAENLHIACEGRHSVELSCRRGSHPAGAIVVHKGEVWSARDEHGHGLDACTRLLADSSVTSLAVELEDPGERNVEQDWRHLLIDAMRQEDERVRGSSAGALQSPGFDDHRREGTRAVLQGRSADALKHFLEAQALDPGNEVVIHNIARLRSVLDD